MMAIQPMTAGKPIAATKNMAVENRQEILSEKGFTLTEMIIAVTLVAMMAVGIWSIFRTGILSWSRGTEYIDASQRHRNITDMVRKQMASAYPLTAPADPDSPGPDYPIFYGTETSLSFVSLSALNFNKSPGLTLVNYEVIPDSEGDYLLVESEQRYLGELPDSVESIDLSSITPLFENLTECYFEYRKADDDADNPGEWVQEWNGQELGELPVAISMTMVTTDTNGAIRNRNMFVPIQAPEVNLPMNTRNLSGVRGRGAGGRGGEPGTRKTSPRKIPGREPGVGRDRGTGREPGMGPPGMGRGPGMRTPGMGRGPSMGSGVGREQ